MVSSEISVFLLRLRTEGGLEYERRFHLVSSHLDTVQQCAERSHIPRSMYIWSIELMLLSECGSTAGPDVQAAIALLRRPHHDHPARIRIKYLTYSTAPRCARGRVNGRVLHGSNV